jgi:hypothetical protein
LHLHEGAGQQRAVLVGHGHLDLHGAAGGVDGAGGARHLAGEGAAAQFGLRHDGLLPGLDQVRIGLRHVDVHAQRVGLRQQEQRLVAVDQVADVDVAAGDDAGERRHHALEVAQLLQALHVGVGAGQVGLGLREAAAALFQLLLRHGVALAQRLPALDRGLGQFQAGGGLVARGDGLRQLLVELGRLDLGQQLALLDAAADVLGPAAQVAAGARRHRRLHEALQRAGQRQRLAVARGA